MAMPRQLDMFRTTPDAFDSLAAMSKFGEVAEWAPSFYARHQRAIDQAVGAVRVLGLWDTEIRILVGFTLAPVDTTASALRGWFASASNRLSERDLLAFDQIMTAGMTGLLPVVRDPDLPLALEECRWGIEAAFAKPGDSRPTVASLV